MANHRQLPWRETKDPYHIYLSEIILQQTQVKQGLSYYEKFLKNYPTIHDLANAKESDVLKDWQGLGYYSRARNMHAAAQQVVNEYGGAFPNHYEDIIKLRGVGKYTAAAIASFAFNEPKAVLDGNVFRVVSRLFGIQLPIDTTKGQKYFQEMADDLLDHNKADIHNQAIMEFGATLCKPKQPKCNECPLQANCIAHQKGWIHLLPTKSKKLKQKDNFYYYFVFETTDEILIHQRREKGIWQNLYDFYLVETSKSIGHQWIDLMPKEISDFELISVSKEYIHLLSHKKIHATFIKIKIPKRLDFSSSYHWIPKGELEKYAIPKLIENYLKEEGNLLSLEL